MLGSIVILIGYSISAHNIEDAQNWVFIRSICVLSICVCFLVVYLITLIVLNKRLKKFFPEFYQKEKSRIKTLHAFIICAIFGRTMVSAFLASGDFRENLEENINNDGWLGPCLEILSGLFTSIFPLAVLLYSLLHAITQKQEIKKSGTLSILIPKEGNETASLISSSEKSR